jgi:hypothetical protein
VHAICTTTSPVSALRYQPLLDVASPTLWIFNSGDLDANATTEAGGEPSTYNSGMEFIMMLAIVRAQEKILQQGLR